MSGQYQSSPKLRQPPPGGPHIRRGQTAGQASRGKEAKREKRGGRPADDHREHRAGWFPPPVGGFSRATRHGEPEPGEVGNELLRRLHREFHQLGPQPRPCGVAGVVGDNLLQGSDHRILRHRVPQQIERLLLRLGVRFSPVSAQLEDRRRVDVRRRGDAAGAAVTHGGKQQRLGADVHVEARP